METFCPRDEVELGEVLHEASRTSCRLRVRGGGTRASLGRSVDDPQAVLQTSGLCGVSLYEPGALHIVLKAGTPLAKAEAVLRENGQMFGFEPMDHRPLLRTEGEPTIGGVVACAVSGPRRLLVGACRDHLLGIRFVDGEGRAVKSGGRVMKNVTGLDLAKLQCGAMGSMGVISEVSLKVLPLPEETRTLQFSGVSPGIARQIFAQALSSPFEISGAAYENKTAYLRIEGLSVQVAHRVERLGTELAAYSPQMLDEKGSKDLWRTIRDVQHFPASDHSVWRVTLRPSRAEGLSELLQSEYGAQVSWDWGGGLLWVVVDHHSPHLAKILTSIAEQSAHCTLIRGGDDLRRGVSFDQSPRIQHLVRNLQRQFDPSQILNSAIV